jgi:hypothetical protein
MRHVVTVVDSDFASPPVYVRAVVLVQCTSLLSSECMSTNADLIVTQLDGGEKDVAVGSPHGIQSTL